MDLNQRGGGWCELLSRKSGNSFLSCVQVATDTGENRYNLEAHGELGWYRGRDSRPLGMGVFVFTVLDSVIGKE